MQDYSLNHIAELIENCISLQEISSNPRLVAILACYNYLPLYELTTSLKNIQIDLDEAVEACMKSNILSQFLAVQPIPILYVPYQVLPATFTLSNVPISASIDQLKAFITEISGTDQFVIEKDKNEEDIPTYTLKFQAIETSLNFWRALKYVPFEGTFITVLPKIIGVDITKINQVSQENNQEHKNNKSKNNRFRYKYTKSSSSSSDDNDADYNSYNNNYRSRNSQMSESKTQMKIIKRKDYLSEKPKIVIECPSSSISKK